ncbi:MAG TPA: hypothetical protein VF947_09815, partial [Myxococcales bacterium]
MTRRLRSVTAVVAQLSFLVLLLGPNPVWAGEASDSTPTAPDKAKSGPKVGDRSKSSPRLIADKPKEKEAP